MDVEDSEMDFMFNGINEDSSENFFILDGIQTFQTNEAPLSPVPGMECTSFSKNFTKENSTLQGNSELFCSSGLVMTPEPEMEHTSFSKNLTKENLTVPGNTEVFCSSGLVMEPSQYLPQDYAAVNDSKSNSISKEINISSSREVILSPGISTVQKPIPVLEDRRSTSTSSLNVFPIGNLAYASNKAVFCSTGLVMFPNSAEDGHSRSGPEAMVAVKKDLVQKPPSSIAIVKPAMSADSVLLPATSITVTKPVTQTKPILFLCPSKSPKVPEDGGTGITPTVVQAKIRTPEKTDMEDKYNICAVNDFVGNAAKAVQNISSPQIVQTSNVKKNEDSVQSLRDVRKSSSWSKSSLSDLVSFRNANSRTDIRAKVIASPMPETVLPPSPVLRDGMFAVPSNSLNLTAQNSTENSVNGMTCPAEMACSTGTVLSKTTTVSDVMVSKSNNVTTTASTFVPMVHVFCSPGLDMQASDTSQVNAESSSEPKLDNNSKETNQEVFRPTKIDMEPSRSKNDHPQDKPSAKENGLSPQRLGESLPKTAESKERSDSETEISVVQEDQGRISRNVVEHTIKDDSDSDVCIVEEQIRKPFRMAKKYRKMKSQYKCSECTFRTTSMKQLQVHEEVHPKGRKIKCSKCSFETRIKSCMIYHAAMHSGGKKFRCSKCPFKTDSLDTFLEHEAQKFKCFMCGSTFHLTKDLVLHMSKAHGSTRKIYVCGACAFTSCEQSEIDAHRKDPNSKAKFECQWSLPEGVKNIIKHGVAGKLNNDEYHCKTCDFTFKNKTAFTRHMRKHRLPTKDHSKSVANYRSSPDDPTFQKLDKGPARYNCLLCDAGFPTKASLRMHHLRKHGLAGQSTAREFKCALCHYVTDEKLFFEKHSKIHSKAPDLNTSKETQLFKCSFCDFETEFEEMIRSHLSTHSESDSDFDGDFESPSTFADVVGSKNVGGDTSPSPSSHQIKPRKSWKFECVNCDFGTNLSKRFYNHRSLHLRKKVFSIIYNPSLKM